MWLTYIPLIMSIISELPGLIMKAEEAFSGKPGSGAAKKAFVQEAAGAALGAYQTVSSHPLPPEHATAILQTVSSLTDTTVQAFNTAGLFMAPKAPVGPLA